MFVMHWRRWTRRCTPGPTRPVLSPTRRPEAFGLPVQEAAPGLPLVCFGLFAPEQVESLTRFPAAGFASLGDWKASIDHAAYLRAIDSIKRSIEAGNTYQINFTFRLTAPFEGDPAALMRDLYAGQAGPWSAYVEAGDHAICSGSPELFFSLEGERVLCRPMKGTAPRGYWTEQDNAFGNALRQSEKNRAENVMIVDMVRNDIGRIARIGSVQATSLFEVERYPLQWQMTSTVEGGVETRSLLRLFEAMFPSGSITGAPKHSSMEIIRRLETTPRGIYTGAIGYMSPRGRAHFNVAIRSVVIDRRQGTAEFGVGSGIVCTCRPRRIRRVSAQGARHRLGRDPDAALCLVCDQRAAGLSVAGDGQVDTRRRFCAARPAHRTNPRVRHMLWNPV